MPIDARLALARSVLALALPALLAGCARGDSCPAVDPQVLARAIVDELEQRAAGGDDTEEVAEDEEEGVSDAARLEAFRSLPFDDLPCRGPRTANVRIVVVSDFECPFCQRFAPTVDRVVERHAERVRMCFVHYPLPFHPFASIAAQAAVEVQRQGGSAAFFRFHDALFHREGPLSEDAIVGFAAAAGVNEVRVREALRDERHLGELERHMALVESLGVGGTPTTLVEGEAVPGAVPFETLEAAVQRALER